MNLPENIPEYCRRGGRLPRGGPDRVRMTFLYEHAFSEVQDHEKALEKARGGLWFMYMYIIGMKGEGLSGDECFGCVPLSALGEE